MKTLEIILNLIKSNFESDASFELKMGLKPKTVDSWKRGNSKAYLKLLPELTEEFNVSADYLLGRPSAPTDMVSFPMTTRKPVKVIGSISAGYNGVAVYDEMGFEFADVDNPDNYVFFHVKGDSMLPDIKNGDFALVRLQSDVDSGDIAIVVYDGEKGTLKKVIKKDNAIILQPLNSAYETKIYTGKELNEVRIFGRLMETKRKF